MLDNEPDTDQTSSNDDSTPAAAAPPRRRRAASRPAGPPTTSAAAVTTQAAVPAPAVPTPAVAELDTPPVSAPAAAPTQLEASAPGQGQTEVAAPVEESQQEVSVTTTAQLVTPPAKKAAAKRAPRKTAAKKAAESVELPPAQVAQPDVAPTDATPVDGTAADGADGAATNEIAVVDAPVAETPRKRAPRKRAPRKTAEPAAPALQNDTAPAASTGESLLSNPAPEVAAEGPAGWDAPAAEDTTDRQLTTEPSALTPTSVPDVTFADRAEITAPDAAVDEDELAEGATGTDQPEPRDFRWLADPFAVPVSAPPSGPAEVAADPVDASDSASSEADTAEVADAGSDDEAGTDQTSSDDDESGDGSNRRRRRRRGGRRRRRGAGDNDNDSGSNDNESDDDSDESAADVPAAVVKAEGDAAEEDSSSDDSSNDGDESDGQGRRRRRRRRRGEETAALPDDPTDVVVRVREPRQRAAAAKKPASDEVTGIQGSTRMEAKRQRRKEGRDAGRRRAPILSEAEFLARRESVNRQMVIRQRDDLSQIAVLEDGILVEHYVDRESAASLIGNVYLGRVQNVLPSMEAAFIDIGRGRNAVLYAGEVDWDSFGAEGHNRKVEKVLKSGQMILVQVSKDPVGAKGARLTNHVSIPGRYIVYAPGGHLSGISRKLPDVERRRLKDILADLVGESASVIVRTAAEGASEDELVRDVNRLKAQWEDIERKVKAGNSPQLLYGEPDLTVRIVRDLFTEDFSELVIQGSGAMNDAYDAIQGYVTHVAPHLQERIRRWEQTGDVDLFTEYRIDEQIAKALERKVFLPSGGSLVIDRTEAMTVIDVNTGKFTGTGGNLEATVTSNNLEAAEEIVNQLRLRDIGGIIVIDFIDMVLPSNRELLLRRLVECLGRDRTRHQVAEVTSLGLVQMTRKKIGTGLLEAFGTECPHCHGRGFELHDLPVDTQQQADGGAREPQRPRDHRTPKPGDNVRGAGSGARGDNGRGDNGRGDGGRGDGGRGDGGRGDNGRGDNGRGDSRNANGRNGSRQDGGSNGRGAPSGPKPEQTPDAGELNEAVDETQVLPADEVVITEVEAPVVAEEFVAEADVPALDGPVLDGPVLDGPAAEVTEQDAPVQDARVQEASEPAVEAQQLDGVAAEQGVPEPSVPEQGVVQQPIAEQDDAEDAEQVDGTSASDVGSVDGEDPEQADQPERTRSRRGRRGGRGSGNRSQDNASESQPAPTS